MKILKYSRQRESIKQYLTGHHDHPTADMVYMELRGQFPNISLGTVYRNLNLLVDIGEIRKLSCGDGADRFDADLSPHHHFICRECGCVLDLHMDPCSQVVETAQQCYSGTIDSHIIYFYGTCQECSKNMNKRVDRIN